MQPGSGSLRLLLCALLGGSMAACDSPSAPPVPAALYAAGGEVQTGTAAGAAAVMPSVRVEDGRGKPIADVPVTFTVTEGAGTVEFGTTVTDRTGTATSGVWTLGARVGLNVLTAAVEGLPPVRFTATASPGAPSVLRVHAGGVQSATVGQAIAVPPTVLVLDANENPVPGAPVTFVVTVGEGAVLGGGASGTLGASTVTMATNAEGLAAPAAWQLDRVAGPNAVEARVPGLTGTVTFLATGLAGPAAGLAAVAGNLQSATVGASVPTAPAVRVTDAFGNSVANVAVTFTVIDGSGGVIGPGGTASAAEGTATVSTRSDGVATLTSWLLGTTAGSNALDVRAAGVEPVLRFTAIGTPGPAASARSHAGDLQVAAAGARVPVAPAVRVVDAFGNAVAGAVVTYEVSGGGGALSGPIQSTGADGIAGLGAWDLGPLPGPNAVTARVGALPAVTFTATGTPVGGTGGSGGSGGSGGGTPGGFTLDVRYTSPLPAAQLAAFDAAAGRWQAAITGDLPSIAVTVAANGCGAPHPAVNEVIDDVVIFVTVQPIDGPGKILGSAGPCRIRSGSGLPAVGIIFLDADDLGSLLNNGLLDDVILHEMGHVLGIGTLWPTGLLVGAGGSDPVFTGGGAVAQFLAAGGSAYSGSPVPVENTGGGGTKDSHWRESVLASEIMTGWINFGGNPFSRVTIASLGDMGYQVDLGAADGFQLSGVSSLGTGAALPGFEMLEGKLPPPIVVTASNKAGS